MANAFVVKTASPELESYVQPGVFERLQKGEARIGWSYTDVLDLRFIVKEVREGRWASLNEDQRNAWRCHGFLDRVMVGDYLVYPHQPEYGKFTIVSVLGEYDYAPEEESIDGDFRSRRKCQLVPSTPISWNDEIVPPIIKCKLGLRGRFWQLYDMPEFNQLLKALPQAGLTVGRTLQKSIDVILETILPSLPTAIQKEFPRQAFSLFCHRLFERMGYISEYREGVSERGSDIIVTVSTPFFPNGIRVGIQAGSFEGTVGEWKTKEKLTQLLDGWEYNALDYGVLISTGDFDSPSRELVKTHNRDNRTNPVTLIDGKEVSRLFLENLTNSTAKELP